MLLTVLLFSIIFVLKPMFRISALERVLLTRVLLIILPSDLVPVTSSCVTSQWFAGEVLALEELCELISMESCHSFELEGRGRGSFVVCAKLSQLVRSLIANYGVPSSILGLLEG